MPGYSTGKKDWEYDVIHEGEENILYVYVENLSYAPSIEDSDVVMSKVVDILSCVTGITTIIFSQKREYEYDYGQTQILIEISNLYKKIIHDKSIFSYAAVGLGQTNVAYLNQRYAELQNLVFKMLKSDPIGAYVELTRVIRREKIDLERIAEPKFAEVVKRYVSIVNYVISMLEETRLLNLVKPYLPGYKIGERAVYKYIFTPSIKPDFMYTKLMSNFPADGVEVESYTIADDTEITIFTFPDDVKILYHMMPPEFKLAEDKYELLDLARKIMAEHKPKEEEFTDPERMRQVFYNIGRDLLEDLAKSKNIILRAKEVEKLTSILVRYTVGFGLIEVLLADEKIQDISVNSPLGNIPLFIVHGDYGECDTNIIPTRSEAESWASKLRLISGRPLDEANPILDTELELPNARTRVAVITKPLDPTGIAYSFRRHRDKPWTLPLFIKQKMINPIAAGLLSFLVDGSRTILIAGTRSAGKSSLLSALLIEIMRKYRILTVEDSVTGDSYLVSNIKGKLKIDKIETIFNSIKKNRIKKQDRDIILNPGIKVYAMDKKGKICLSKASKLIRHKVNKTIYQIITSTGRAITVTGDHSLFCICDESVLKEAKASKLRVNDFIATPRIIHMGGKHNEYYGITNDLLKKPNIFVKVKSLSKEKVKKQGKRQGYSKSAINKWIRTKLMPIKIAEKSQITHFKVGNSTTFFDTMIWLDKDFLTFVGLWIADGCYDWKSVIMSVSSEEEQNLVKKIAKRFNLQTKMHSDRFSLMINSVSFKLLMKDILMLDGNAYTKKIPEWVFNLSKKQIGYFLKGLFSGDGCASDKEIIISLASKKLLKDIQLALLGFNIIFRINALREHKSKKNDRTMDGRISVLESLKIYKKEIGFLQKSKNNKLNKLLLKSSTHDSSDIIPLPLPIKKQIGAITPRMIFNQNDYIKRKNNVGRKKLKKIVEYLEENKKDRRLTTYLKMLANSDIFWDRIVKITKINKPQYVYDISVPGHENFICENILAHNTLELPTRSLRDLGFNIQSMKVASALAGESTEVSASTGIRTTLRLGDSALIVGEVRSKEAVALYEAMRVGAAANVVAGTIHGDSPFGVYDRVVNDIGIPKTSFKATDVVVVTNPVRSADGLHRFRRVTQITEVRKYWQDDPLKEGGFVDLMKYDAKSDTLKLSDDIINGDSDILKSIAGNIKEFAGDWDALWSNVLLRAKIKETLTNTAIQINNLELLEAPFVIKANDKFHLLTDKIKEETGGIDDDRIFFEWNEWLKREVRKKGVE